MIERYALLIKPSQEEPRDLYLFNAGTDLIRHLLVTYYSVQQGNILSAGTKEEIDNRISTIQDRARTAKANGKTTQLLIYVTGHSVILGGEQLLENAQPIEDIMAKEGGGNLSIVLRNTGNPVTDTLLNEYDLKFSLQWELQSPIQSDNKNVIDNIFVIFETCGAGAAVI